MSKAAPGVNGRKEFHQDRGEMIRAEVGEEIAAFLADPAEEADEHLWNENTLMWALYRHPDTEYTQMEAHRASIREGPTVSQSSLSRKIKRLDEQILSEGTDEFDQLLHPEDTRKWRTDILDAYREVVARTIVSLRALGLIWEPDIETPEWAREQYPELAELYDSVNSRPL